LSRVSSEKSGGGEDADEDGDDADEGGGGPREEQLVKYNSQFETNIFFQFETNT